MRLCVLVTVLCLLPVSVANGQWVETVIHLPDSLSGARGIYWLGYDSLTNTVYAAGFPGTVAIDATSHQKVACLPHWGAWVGSDAARGKLYICGDSVYVLDAQTRALLTTIPVDIDFYQVTAPAALCTAFGKLYVVSQGSLAVIDTRGDSLIKYVRTGHLFGVYLAEAENKLYCHDDQYVFAIDCRTDSVGAATVSAPGACWSPTAYNSLTRKLYYGSVDGLYVIDCRADTVVNVLAEQHHFSHVFCDPQANRIYALLDLYAVAVFDGSTDSLVKVVPTGLDVASAYFSPDLDRFYALDFDRGGAIMDCVRDTLLGYFGRAPGDFFAPFCENPQAREVYCGDFESSVVTVLDGVGDSVEASVITGDRYLVGPLWYNAQSNKVLGLGFIGGLSVINAGTNTHEGTRLVAGEASGLVYNSTAQKLYTLDRPAGNVVAISPVSETASASIACSAGVGSVICANAVSNKVFCGRRVLWAIDSRVDSVVAGIPLPLVARALKSATGVAKVYVADWDRPQVVVVDAAGDSILRVVDVPASVAEMGYSPAQRRRYCLGATVDSMFVLDADGDSLVASVAAPRGIAPEPVWNSCTDRLYYHSTDGGRLFVTVLDCRTNQVLRTLNATYVRGCDSVRNRVYCTDDSALLVYDGATDSLIVRVPVPSPGYLALNPADGRVYLGSSYSDVYVIRDPTAVVEGPRSEGRGVTNDASVVRGCLFLPSALPTAHYSLLSADGRKVMELRAGLNDVRRLAPGVYFVREGPQASSFMPQAVRKVVLTR